MYISDYNYHPADCATCFFFFFEQMGINNLIPLLITMQLIKTNNVQSFCEYWHRRTKKPCRVGIDGSTVIHTHLRKHKDTLMINASNIDKCPKFRKSLLTCISEMKKWDTGNVVLHFVCDGRRINMKLQNEILIENSLTTRFFGPRFHY